MIRPLRRPERNVPVGAPELDQDRIAHRLGVGLLRGVRLVEFIARLAAAAVFRTGETQDAVAGTVGEQFPFNLVAAVFGEVPAGNRSDAAVFGLDLFDRRIQQDGQIFLLLRESVHDIVPDRVLHGRIVVIVVELKLFEESGLLAVFAVSAADPHADFARGVAAEHRAVLDDHGLCSVARGGDGRAESGDAAADHDEVGGESASGNNHSSAPYLNVAGYLL